MESPKSTPCEEASVVNNVHVVKQEVAENDFFQDQQHCNRILQALKVQKDLGVMCDITIEAGDLTLPAHKCVLAANSAYFNSLFASTSSDAPSTLNFALGNSDAFSNLLNFMYTGEILLQVDKIHSYLRLNRELKMPNIQQTCIQYLSKVISADNWSSVLDIAKQNEFSNLIEQVQTFIALNFATLCNEKKVLLLPYNLFARVVQQANPGKLWMTEYLILETILKYSQLNPLESDEFDQLICMVNVNVMSVDNVTSVIEKLEMGDDPVLEKFISLVKREGLSKQASLSDGLLMSRPSKRAKQAAVQEAVVTEIKEPEARAPVKRKRGRPRKIVTPVVEERLATPEDDYEDEFAAHDDDEEGDEVVDEEKEKVPPTKRKRGPYKKKTDGAVFQCTKCPKLFRSQSLLQRHMKGHGSDQPLECDACDFSTLHRSSLDTHMQTHNGAKFKCLHGGCSYECTRRQQLEDHINNRHLGLLSHVCSVCGKTFAGRKHLQRHERLHSGEQLKCEHCDWSTTRRDKLRDHIRRHHPDWALESGFATEDEVNKWKLARGPRSKEKKETPPPKAQREFPKGYVHKCMVIGCSFETNKFCRFRDHSNSHLGIKNYICAVCGKAFGLQRDLTRHEFVHLEVKPYQCSQCEWATTRSDKLREHVCRQHPDWAIETGFATMEQIEKVRTPVQRKPRGKKQIVATATTEGSSDLNGISGYWMV